MAFDEPQLDLIRSRLWAYKELKRSRGGKLAWKVVHSRLMESEDTPFEFDREGRPTFSVEALRRFALGSQTFDDETKIEGIVKFLVRESVLTHDEIDAQSIVSQVSFADTVLNNLSASLVAETDPVSDRLVGVWSVNKKMNEKYGIEYTSSIAKTVYRGSHILTVKEVRTFQPNKASERFDVWNSRTISTNSYGVLFRVGGGKFFIVTVNALDNCARVSLCVSDIYDGFTEFFCTNTADGHAEHSGWHFLHKSGSYIEDYERIVDVKLKNDLRFYMSHYEKV